MKTRPFTTKDGKLTPYAFACGYINRTETGNKRIVLEKPSPSGTYWVSEYIDEDCDGIKFNHFYFSHIKDARKKYRQLGGKLKIN